MRLHKAASSWFINIIIKIYIWHLARLIQFIYFYKIHFNIIILFRLIWDEVLYFLMRFSEWSFLYFFSRSYIFRFFIFLIISNKEHVYKLWISARSLIHPLFIRLIRQSICFPQYGVPTQISCFSIGVTDHVSSIQKKKNLFIRILDLNLRRKLVNFYIWSIAGYGDWALRK
jgi:hypothetical protein